MLQAATQCRNALEAKHPGAACQRMGRVGELTSGVC